RRTMTDRNDLMLLVDVETTGLNPRMDCLLEVGFMLIDGGLNALSTYHSLIRPLPFPFSGMSDFVRTMHEKSELLDDLADAGDRHHHVVAIEVKAWLERQARELGQPLNTIPLGGSSVHFDRGMLQQWMPRVEELLFYRNIDVSTIKQLVARWYGKPDLKAMQ